VDLGVGIDPHVPGESDVEVSEPQELTLMHFHRFEGHCILLITRDESWHRVGIWVARYGGGQDLGVPDAKHTDDEEFQLLKVTVDVDVDLGEWDREDRNVFQG